MRRLILAMTLIFGFGLVTKVSAQTATPSVKKSQVKQQKRIKKGVKSGELTKGETIRLQKEQAKINRTKKRAQADGVVTKKERARLNKMQAKQSKNIYIKKNNDNNRQ